MILLACNDLHLSSRAPASRLDTDYPEELFELLDQLLKLGVHLQAGGILLAGDVFHNGARIDWDDFTRLARWCRTCIEAGMPIYTVPGNHDLIHNRYESLPETPLGMLYDLGLLVNCSTTRGESVTHAGAAVQIYGVPFPDAFDLTKWRMDPVLASRRRRDSYTIVLGHCFAARAAGDYFGEPVHSYQSLLAATSADVIVLGHDHTDRGATKIGAQWVIDLGAMARGSIARDDVTRDLKLAVIDTTANSVQLVRYQFRPADTIFDLAAKATREAEQAHLETFVAALKSDLSGLTPTGTTLDAKLDTLQLSGEVLTRIRTYIDSVEANQ